MLGKPIYGQQFFAPEGDGGAGGGSAGDDGGDGNGAPDGQTDGGEQGEPGRSTDDQNPGEDVSGLKSALQTERRTNAAIKEFARTRNITVAQAIEQFTKAEDANKTELQRAADERDVARQRAEATELKLRTANARSAVTDAASKANAISVNAVFALVRDSLEFDDDGEPTNVAEVMAEAKKNEPTLFKAAAGRGDGHARDEDTQREVRPGVDRMADAYAKSSKTAVRPR